MNRRSFLQSASTVAFLASTPAFARFLRGGGSTFNGGKSQGQSGAVNVSGDFPFLNIIKQGSTWLGRDAQNGAQPIDPSWLASDGYPLASALNGTNGVQLNLNLPAQTSYPGASGNSGNVQILWDVTGAGPSDQVTLQLGVMGTTTVSGSLTSTGNGTNFQYIFTPNYTSGVANGGISLSILSLGGTAHLSNLRMVFDGLPATLLAQGKTFNPQFLSVLGVAKFGVYRLMDWLGTNITNVTTFATRKSQSYVTWANDEFRASLSAGVTSGNVGNDYSITIPGSYVWTGPNGNYTGGAPVHNQTMHMRFNADGTFIGNNQNGGTLTINSLTPLTFGWPSNPLSNGNPVSITTGFFQGGNQIGGTNQAVTYYVVNSTGSTFQVALTPGGAAINATSSGGGSACVSRCFTLNIGTGGAIPILLNGAQAFVDASQIPRATFNSGTSQLWATLVYDSVLNVWIMVGGSDAQFSNGLVNSTPIEVCFELCKELGMHPHWSLPFLALDKPTDYATSLAAYNIANNPGWMIPHYEPGNEVWNLVTPITNFAMAKAFAYWGVSASVNDWYSMALSNMGQGIKTTYGGSGLGTTYEVMCGVQTDGGLGASTGLDDSRLTAPLYISIGPSVPGYTRQSAVSTTSAVLVATYVSPQQRGKTAELQNAWNYSFTNVGNPTAQLANLNNYADSLSANITGTATFTNGSAVIGWSGNLLNAFSVVQFGTGCPSPFVAGKLYYVLGSGLSSSQFEVAATSGGTAITAGSNGSSSVLFAPYAFTNSYEAQRYQGYQVWASGLGVSKMFAYEGGYSPDLMSGNSNFRGAFNSCFQSSPESTAPTRATQCVVTINNVSGSDNQDGGKIQALGGNPQVGNPCLTGMLLAFDGTGCPELENQSANITFNASGPNQTWTAHNLHVNEVVIFSSFNGTVPSNITFGQSYFVVNVVDANTFQFSATRGGSAITPNAADTVTVVSAFVVVSVSGTQTTIDVNSTGFAVPTGSMFTTYVNSLAMVNSFRIAVLFNATDLPAQLLANYNNFTAAGGLFPSQYQFAGLGSVWFVVQPDSWGTQSGELAAITYFNTH